MPEIDLSRLPAPTVVEPLDYETILAAMMADFTGRYPDFTGFVESEPAMKLFEVAAYREWLLRARINDAAKQTMLAFARGTNLAHLTALADVERQAGESDERLLRRFRLSLEAFSVSGPRGAYEFHALSADPSVKAATVTSPTPGAVRVVVLGGPNADGLPPAALVTKVRGALDDASKRPLTDTVEVLAARNILYQVAVTIHVEDGPDESLVKAAAERAVLAYLLARHRVSEVVYRSAIVGAAQVPGVTHVTVTLYWDTAQPYTGDSLDVGSFDLAAIPVAWKPVAAFWPAKVASVSGGSAATLDGAIKGYESPASAPADGLTVTVG